jgi:hypothetical protein
MVKSTKVTTKVTTKPQVSNLGRYRNHLGVISTPKPTPSGYVCIQINGKLHKLHRVMAVAFGLTKRDDQDTADHIDGNPSNNRIENLRWANRSEQIRHSYATNEKRASNASKLSKPVLGRALGTHEWTEYPSTQEAALELRHGCRRFNAITKQSLKLLGAAVCTCPFENFEMSTCCSFRTD